MTEKSVKTKSSEQNVEFKLCLVNRSTKVVTGGRRFRFSAGIIAGDMKSKIGWGFAKANSVSDAIKKAEKKAASDLMEVPKIKGTVPCIIEGRNDSVKVMLKPAKEGTGIVAGSIPALILNMGGYTDVVAKTIKGSNKMNQVNAVFDALIKAKKRIEVAEFRKSERKAK